MVFGGRQSLDKNGNNKRMDKDRGMGIAWIKRGIIKVKVDKRAMMGNN